MTDRISKQQLGKQRSGVQNRQRKHADKNEHHGRQAIKACFDCETGTNAARRHDRSPILGWF